MTVQDVKSCPGVRKTTLVTLTYSVVLGLSSTLTYTFDKYSATNANDHKIQGEIQRHTSQHMTKHTQ